MNRQSPAPCANLIVVGKNSNIVVKNFDTIEEFQQYYNLHKDEVDKYSTTKLNRMFKIKDHKITRRTIAGNESKTLCFRQLFKNELTDKESDNGSNKDSDESRIDELENEITELNSKIKNIEVDNIKIKNQLLEIIRVMNQSN